MDCKNTTVIHFLAPKITVFHLLAPKITDFYSFGAKNNGFSLLFSASADNAVGLKYVAGLSVTFFMILGLLGLLDQAFSRLNLNQVLVFALDQNVRRALTLWD